MKQEALLYLHLCERWDGAMRNADAMTANELYTRIQSLTSAILAEGNAAELSNIADVAPDAAALFIAANFLNDNPEKRTLVYEKLALSDLPHIAASAGFILRERREKMKRYQEPQ